MPIALGTAPTPATQIPGTRYIARENKLKTTKKKKEKIKRKKRTKRGNFLTPRWRYPMRTYSSLFYHPNPNPNARK